MLAGAGPFGTAAMIVTGAALLGSVVCRLIVLGHGRPDVPRWKLLVEPLLYDYALYTPVGERWMHRALRAGAVALLGFWVAVVCLFTGW